MEIFDASFTLSTRECDVLAKDVMILAGEHAQLKRIVADLTLDKQMLQDVLKKKL